MALDILSLISMVEHSLYRIRLRRLKCRLIQVVSPVFCKKKVWICCQSLSVECLGSLCVASVEEEGAKVGEQLRVGHSVDRLLVDLWFCRIMSGLLDFVKIWSDPIVSNDMPIAICKPS